MAIKRGPKSSAKQAVPTELLQMAESAFTAQQMSDCFKGVFDAEKKEIFAFLETTDEVTLDASNKTLDVGCGAITFSTRQDYTIDKSAINSILDSGHINIHTLLEIAKFSASDLKTVLGARFSEVATAKEPTEILTLKANADFKAKVAEQFEQQFSSDLPLPKKKVPAAKAVAPEVPVKQKAKSKKVAMSVSESLDAIKAAKSGNDVDSDLDAILGE